MAKFQGYGVLSWEVLFSGAEVTESWARAYWLDLQQELQTFDACMARSSAGKIFYICLARSMVGLGVTGYID